MAEERLIDDDLNKDKKYRIRKNADGEDELFIDESVEEESEETIGFDVPEFGYDDEEAAVMTPEQLAAREQAKREEEERRKRAFDLKMGKAREKYAAREFESALYELNAAAELNPGDGELAMLKMLTLSRNFTDYTQVEQCGAIADDVKNYCSEEQKDKLLQLSEPLKNKIYALEESAAAMHVEVEAKKAERREVFLADRKRSVLWFSLTAIPFLVCLIVAAAFASVMFARQDGVYLYLTIVFAALAAIFLVATLFTAHKMWEAMKKLSLNSKNSSTKLGREYEATLADIEKLNTVYNSFKKNDIS